jgi:hypothetical protein
MVYGRDTVFGADRLIGKPFLLLLLAVFLGLAREGCVAPHGVRPGHRD